MEKCTLTNSYQVMILSSYHFSDHLSRYSMLINMVKVFILALLAMATSTLSQERKANSCCKNLLFDSTGNLADSIQVWKISIIPRNTRSEKFGILESVPKSFSPIFTNQKRFCLVPWTIIFQNSIKFLDFGYSLGRLMIPDSHRNQKKKTRFWN